MVCLKITRVMPEDDTSETDLQQFSRNHEIDVFVIKTCAKKGRMAGGAVSFKIETLIRPVEGSEIKFVSPVALSE